MFPEIELFTNISLPTYFVWMSFTSTLGVLFFYKSAIQNNLSGKMSAEISILVMVFGFLGARLFHIIFEYPEYYLNQPLEAFKFWKGGYVYFGGFLASLTASIYWIHSKKQNIKKWLDAFAPIAALTYSLGRIGCFLAGCCYGKQCDFIFTKHPTQIYATLWEACVFLILIKFKKFNLKPGSLFFSWMILHGFGRVILEQFRGDFRGDFYFGISISTYLSLVLVIVGFYLFIRNQRK